MVLKTRSSARALSGTKQSSGSRAVRGKKSKALGLRNSPTKKPTRKSNRSTSNNSKDTRSSRLENHTTQVESDSEDDLPDNEDIYKALTSNTDESNTGDLDSDNEVLEALAKRPTRARRANMKRVTRDKSQQTPLANPLDDPHNITARLEAQFANSPSNPNPLENLELDDEVEDNSVLPSIQNYKELVKEWPRKRITTVQNSQKKVTSVPPHILVEAKAIKKLYKHHKRMLAMMGNITPYTLDKSLGELGGTRFPDAYRLWLKFSVEARKLKMPRRGQAGNILANCNHEPIDLLPEDREELQGIYDGAVCAAKVRQVYAKASSGITEGRTVPKYNQLSLKCVEKLHNQIENEANRMDFGYYFLASSTHPATGGDSADPGWCKEYTSNEELADYVRSKSNFPTIFAAQTQGISVDKVIAKKIGKAEKMKMNQKRVDPGDKVKSDLAACLKSALGFPRGPDPVLKLGFNAMNSCRSLWLNDLQAGLFRFEKIPEDQDDLIADDEEERHISDNQGNLLGDNHEEPLENDEQLGLGIEEEPEEWKGIGEDETEGD
ncbi:uncharacterized protein MELLADRAFT_93877 [Melampsora larici-populina 98AG31]|uniref:Uncharacterized protein n=1 Tax=Melampsora larici-populina (strain 98AG31 / pathotype 3-4-7) TaxID=747676 RepID=F4S5L0_MELLP|nr:uncharacterized protein MELLADRAFT_93877 [Melampsora larici-populina 98AG31]EGG00046.1 hypothetical protein MELLADRAFT_93877 [Melampsora larici-populina 98AG31]